MKIPIDDDQPGNPDLFDARASRRPHKAAWSRQRALHDSPQDNSPTATERKVT